LLPTEKGVFVLCDAGANIDSSPQNLLQFGIMGAVFAEQVLGLKRPTVGLLSIGEEDVKGNDTTKEAFKLLKSANLNFRGNVEGHDLYEDGAEVVVCDGFVGNIVLKTSESIAYAIFGWLRRELAKKFIRKLGAQLARGAFRTIYKKTNSEEYGGMPLLGVNGTCIIAHGSSSPVAIKNAIRVAAESIQHDLNPQIIREIQAYNDKFATASTAVQ
jgi:glycerol-3-phosphate acyltransferase PlsX